MYGLLILNYSCFESKSPLRSDLNYPGISHLRERSLSNSVKVNTSVKPTICISASQ